MPVPFGDIARNLNRLRAGNPAEYGGAGPRPFTSRDCLNRWRALFPSAADTSATMAFLERLKALWPCMKYWTDSEVPGASGAKPVVTGLHVWWPWSGKILRVLAPSLFCDATFKVTTHILGHTVTLSREAVCDITSVCQTAQHACPPC